MSAGSPTPSKSVQLSELSIPRLFFHLLRTRFTGRLTLDQPEPDAGERTVWVRGGMPVFTDWVSPPDSLGELLVGRRVLSPDALAGALEQAKNSGQILGQVLLQGGSLDPSKLSSALRLQCARKLLRAFALSEGEVRMEASETIDVSEDLQGQVNVLQLIYRGILAHYDEARITAEMGDEANQTMTASKALTRYQSQFGFPREDAKLLRSLLRGATLDSLAATHDRGHAAQIAFTLWTCQMLRTGNAGDAAKAKPKPKPKREVIAAKQAPPPPPGAGLSQPPPTEGSLPPPPGFGADAGASSVPAPPDFDSRPREVPPETHENVISRPREGSNPPSAPPASRKPPASSRAKPEVDPKRRAELEAELEKFEKKIKDEANAFEIFDLTLEAGRKEIRGRWAELSKNLHPDTLEAYGLSYLQPRMEAVFAAVSEAYGVLSNKDERARLVAMIKAGGSGKAGEDAGALVKNALQADMLARDAEKAIRAGRYEAALKSLREADQLNPDDPSIAGSVAYCEFALTKHTKQDAHKALDILTTTRSRGCTTTSGWSSSAVTATPVAPSRPS
jgi:tetratricopeptide (TPR) repeat protein